ncbi:MAG TPA: hypothetical protein VMF69_22330 [Gemmataceae bacterium]|nr:hypothetical protein [Gemmataceae bacterium]
MCRQSLTKTQSAVPIVLVALLMPALASAEPPQQESTASRSFGFVQFKAEHLATLTIAAPCSPQIGPWSALAAVYAGASLDVPVWDLRGLFSTKAGRINAGASGLFLSGFGPPVTTPLTELVMLQAGERRDCWELINTDTVRPIPKYFLTPGFIRDRTGIYNGALELEAYWQFLVQAHYTSAQAFARAARRDVAYVHLFNEPEQYRGEVVHVSGRLIKLLDFTPSAEARAAGVSHLYEGWIMTDAFGENPVCIVFTDLPSGLTVDYQRKFNDPASFDGYFYKRYRYKAYDSKKANEYRDAPLLIGHTLTGRFENSVAHDESDGWEHSLIWLFLEVVGGAVLGLIALTIWFRYHDRRIHHRIRASRNAEFVPPSEEL